MADLRPSGTQLSSKSLKTFRFCFVFKFCKIINMYFYVFYSWTFIFLKSYLCRVSFTANTNLQSNTVICDISGIVRVVRNLKYTEHNDATIVVHYKRPDRSAVGPSISLKLQITQLMSNMFTIWITSGTPSV